MDDDKQIKPLDQPNEVPIELKRIRRSGGYFLGAVGWVGLVSQLIRGLVFFLVSGAIYIGGFLGFILLDESARIGLRTLLGELGPETSEQAQSDQLFPILAGDGRDELPVRWKQLLSEVQLEQSTYPPRFVSMVRSLTLAEIRIIDELAPYVVRGVILRNSDSANDHDIPALQWADFARLRTIGVLQQGQFGQQFSSSDPSQRSFVLQGTTLELLVTGSDSAATPEISVTALTEEGRLIVELLNRATSLSGLCESAAHLSETGLSVRIRAALEPAEDAWPNPQWVGDVTSLCSPD